MESIGKGVVSGQECNCLSRLDLFGLRLSLPLQSRPAQISTATGNCTRCPRPPRTKGSEGGPFAFALSPFVYFVLTPLVDTEADVSLSFPCAERLDP